MTERIGGLTADEQRKFNHEWFLNNPILDPTATSGWWKGARRFDRYCIVCGQFRDSHSSECNQLCDANPRLLHWRDHFPGDHEDFSLDKVS